MRLKVLSLYLHAILYAFSFYLLIDESATLEDPYSYYTLYKWSNLSWSEFIDPINQLLSDYIDSDPISFSKINVIAHFYYGTLANLQFKHFIFLNILILSLLAFFIFKKISNESATSIFLILFSLPMAVNMFFTWRQALAQFIMMILLLSLIKFKKILILMITLLIHPLSITMLSEREILGIFSNKTGTFFLMLIFFLIGAFIANFTTIGITHDAITTSYLIKNVLWIFIYILYILPLVIYRKRIKLKNTNILIFIALLIGYLIFSTDIVGISRLISFGCISAMFYAIIFISNITIYYKILSPTIFVTYLLTIR